MSCTTWEPVEAKMLSFPLTRGAALAAGVPAAAPEATRVKPDRPSAQRIIGVHTSAVAQPKRHASGTRHARHSAARAVAWGHAVVLLASGSGYQQAAGSGLVRALQRCLASLGFAPGPVDGRYGQLTTRAIERFQGGRRLTVNGIVGAHTLRALGTVQRSPISISSPTSHPAPKGHSALPTGPTAAERSSAKPVTPVLPLLVLPAVVVFTVVVGLEMMSLSYWRTPAGGGQR